MDEIKSSPDISVRFNTSKNNIQLNSKTQGTQSINFQEILTNIGDVDQKSMVATNNQNVALESIQSQSNENELSQGNDSKNINNDKNASTSIKTNTGSSSQSTLFSEYTPQKPVDIENLNLNNTSKEKKELVLVKAKKNKKSDNKVKDKPKINLVLVHKSDSRNQREVIDTNDSENKETNTSLIKKDSLTNHGLQKKDDEFQDKEEQNRKPKHEIYQDNEVSDQEITDILESYGLDIPDFIGRGDNQQDDNWVRNMIFGSLKENINVNDADKITKFLVNKNPEKLDHKDKKVFTKLVNDIFKHQITSIQPEIFSRFEKNTSEFILKNFPHIIYSGSLKKFFDNDDKKVTESKLKVFLAFLSNEKAEKEDIKAFLAEDENSENIEQILNGDYTEMSHENLYNSLNKIKQSGISFGSFTDNIHEVMIEFYENKSKEKLKQTARIISEYRKYNFISESDSHSLANIIVKKYFTSANLSQNKLTEIVTKIIQGDHIEDLYLDLINKALNKNLLSYLPNTINHQVYGYLRNAPFYHNEFISDKHSEEDIFKFFIKVKYNNLMLADGVIELTNTDNLEDISLNINKDNQVLYDLLNGTYKIKLLTVKEKTINLAEIDKSFSLDFSVDKKTNIFYFGTLDIKENQQKNITFKVKNEYKLFLDTYKKKYPEFFKKATIRVNPKLFKNNEKTQFR